MKTRLLFLINSLNPGGAERQLCELVRNLDLDRFEVHLVVFYDSPTGKAFLWSQVASLPGVTLTSLHKRRGPAGYLMALPRLLGILRRTNPDIVHGYMEGNLPLLILGRLLGKRVVWGIRRTNADWSKVDRISRWLLGILVKVSPFVDLIIFNSEAGRRNHVAMGMRAPRMEVIPNGFDVARFRPDADLGADRRLAWGISSKDVPLIGIVGRLDPVKDHATFLRAAALLAREWPATKFVCIGDGPEDLRLSLRDLAISMGIEDRVLWPGTCEDMTAVYNALSLLVLSSTDEGFPNVLGEAMACGTPCVTTRVGDAAVLVGGTGIVVEPGDAEAIAAAVSSLLRESASDKAARAEAARLRVCTTFSVEALARNTESLLLSLPKPVPPSIPSKEARPFGGARYLLRFDDMCPTMDWPLWDEVEGLLVEAGVSPILAVIPDNRDSNLMVGPASPAFWDRVRIWQSRGWSIGLHGYQHTYVNAEAGILRMNKRSEFAGLSYEEQLEKLRKGLEVFKREGVRADTWVAPAHSFDWVTLSALKDVGIRSLSDGIALAPYRDPHGIVWVPQQFAHMRPLPFGITTFCYHLKELTPSAMVTFRNRLKQLGPQMISLQEAERMGDRPRSTGDRMLTLVRQGVLGLRRAVRANPFRLA